MERNKAREEARVLRGRLEAAQREVASLTRQNTQLQASHLQASHLQASHLHAAKHQHHQVAHITCKHFLTV